MEVTVSSMQQLVLRILTLCFLKYLFFTFGNSYKLECPRAVQWKLRAIGYCSSTNDTDKYFCLLDILKNEYKEGCSGPDWDRKGSKRVLSGDFTRGVCSRYRYQPFDFLTNGNSECVYNKTVCAEEGQVISSHGSGYLDRTCRCDFSRGYNYTQPPADLCNCNPSFEDCSCIKKECCDSHDIKALDLECPKMTFQNGKEDQGVSKKSVTTIQNNIQVPILRRYLRFVVTGLVWVMIVLIIGMILNLLADMPYYFDNQKNKVVYEPHCLSKMETYKSLQGQFNASTQDDTNNTDTSSVERNQLHNETVTENGDFFSDEEINHSRIQHLLFCVACPVVRMVFNDEINPKELRKTLDQSNLIFSHKTSKMIRRKTFIIYPPKDSNNNSSDSFDIKLMINLLKELQIFRIGDRMPLPFDTRKDALLSRIQIYRSVIVDAVDGKLSDGDFQSYWKEIGQTILRLASWHLEKISRCGILKEHLLALSPIEEDDVKLQHYVLLTERFPHQILQQLIREYSSDKYNDDTLISFFKDEKHNLLHKRKKQEYCCKCSVKTFSYIISDTLWNKLYMYKEKRLSHTCEHKQMCFMRYDLNFNFELSQEYSSVLILLVLNTPRLLDYIVRRMYTEKIFSLLDKWKHSIYHAVDRFSDVKCCFCKDGTVVKMNTMLTLVDWNKLFIHKNTSVCTVEQCCCIFSVKDNVNIDILDETLLSKIMSVAGPFHVFDKCQENTLTNFMCWDGEPGEYLDACGELLDAVKDVEFKQQLRSKFSSSCPTAEDFVQGYLGNWIIRNAASQKTPTGPKTDLVVLLQERGKLSATQNLPVSNNARVCFSRFRMISWTQEEARFIKLNYLLSQVVCPVVRREFDHLMSAEELESCITKIYYKDLESRESQRGKKNKVSDKDPLRLTFVQCNRVFLTKQDSTGKRSDVLDLSLMIRILEENKNSIDTFANNEELYSHLEKITRIRRTITHSPSGILANDEFDDYWHILSNVVVSLTGEPGYKRRLDDLKTQDILKDM